MRKQNRNYTKVTKQQLRNKKLVVNFEFWDTYAAAIDDVFLLLF